MLFYEQYQGNPSAEYKLLWNACSSTGKGPLYQGKLKENLNFFCKKLEIIADISKSNFLQQKVNAVYVVIFATQVCIGCDFHDNSICLILALNFGDSQVFDADKQQTQKKTYIDSCSTVVLYLKVGG